ncbi:hypothetical protein KAZ66_02100 [Candidatus Woesebacteria bacterium]|nr:hypothetical protein [Candidatus Woesebacteria bacterium]
MKNKEARIIAGPCSVDDKNISEIREIASITIDLNGKKHRAVAGTRIVGLKSRTELSTDGKGMGMDFPAYNYNMDVLLNGGSIDEFKILPSALIAEEIYKETNMIIATEIMNPIIQLPSYIGRIGKGKLLPWNPAVAQLGWHVEQMAAFARKYGWHIGLKNGKWIGDHLHTSDREDYAGQTTMEKAWIGLVRYAGELEHDIVLIHRGVDVPGKGDYRNAPVHTIAKRVKKDTRAKLYFDPSHSYGPKMRDSIPQAIIDAMKMKLGEDEFVYDGVLVETGTSSTDTEQHITVAELRDIIKEIATFRTLII